MSEFALDSDLLLHYRRSFTGDTQKLYDGFSNATKAQWQGINDYYEDPSDVIATMALRPLLGDFYSIDDDTVWNNFDAYSADLARRLGLDPSSPSLAIYNALSKNIQADPRVKKFEDVLESIYALPEPESAIREQTTTEKVAEARGIPRDAPKADQVRMWAERVSAKAREEKEFKEYDEDELTPEPLDWSDVMSSDWFRSADKDARLMALLIHREWRARHMKERGMKAKEIDAELDPWFKQMAGHALIDARMSGITHFSSEIIQGAMRSIFGAMRGAAEAYSLQDPEERPRFAMALGDVEQSILDAIPEDPVLREGFWTGKLPSGIGSALGFAVGGAAAQGSRWGVAALGASAGVSEAVDRARAAGREDKAAEAALLGASLGSLEGMGFAGFGSKTAMWDLLKSTPAGTLIKKRLVRALKEGTEEALQETLQGLGSHLYFKHSGITPDIVLDKKDLVENGAVGFIVGGGLSAISSRDPTLPRIEAALTSAIEESVNQLPEGKIKAAVETRIATGEDVKSKTLADIEGSPTEMEKVAQEMSMVTDTPEAAPLAPLTQEENFPVSLKRYARRLFRETNIENALVDMPTGRVTSPYNAETFFSNVESLALGQGKNKGVLMEFDTSLMEASGIINRRKPGWRVLAEQGEAEFISKYHQMAPLKQALVSLTVMKDAKASAPKQIAFRRALKELEEMGWAKTEVEGGLKYTAPVATPDIEQFGPTTPGGGIPEENLTLQRTDEGTVTAPDVIEAIADSIQASGSKAPLRVGNLSSKKALGEYHTKSRVGRIKVANNITKAAHEAAHAIEDAIFGTGVVWTSRRSGISRAMQKELTDLGKALYTKSVPTGGFKSEGFAEFMRLWYVDEDVARREAPSFFDWFESNVLDANPKLAKALRTAQQKAHTWQRQGARARVREHRVKTGSFRHRKEKLLGDINEFTAKRAWLEAGQAIYEFQRQAEEEAGKQGMTLGRKDNPFSTFSARRMTHDPVAAYMAETAMVDIAGNHVGPSLREALDPVHGHMEDFVDYLYARRARALYDEAGGRELGARNPGISKDDADFVYNELHSEEFEIAAQGFYKWADQVLDYMAAASFDFAPIVDMIRKRDPGDYIPLQREFAILDERYRSRYRSGTKGAPPFSRLRGSGRRIINPIESALSQTRFFLKAAHEKMVLDKLIRLSEEIEGMGNLLVRVPRGVAPVASRSLEEMVNEVAKRIQAAGGDVDVVDNVEQEIRDLGIEEQAIVMFAPKYQPNKAEDPILPVYRDGQIQWYQMDRDLYRAVMSMDGFRFGRAMDLVFGLPTRTFRMGTTGMRPAFSLMTNPSRDVVTLIMNSQSGASWPRILGEWFVSMAQAGVNAASGGKIKNAYIDLFERLGGPIAQPATQDTQYVKRAARRMFETRGMRIVDVRNWPDFIRELLQFPEMASRITELKLLAKKEGIDINGPLTPEQSEFLILAAKQVTTDFTAAGEKGKQANQVIPFFNAAIQGPRAHIRAARHHPYVFAFRALYLTAASLALWWRYKDEEWWQEMSAREKYSYTYIPLGDEMLRLPRPFELGGLSMALPIAIADAWNQENPEEVAEWGKMFFEATTPDFMPVLGKVTMEQWRNKVVFFDKPIVPRALRPLEKHFPEKVVTPYTTSAAKHIGGILGVAPVRIDHIIRGVFGGVGADVAAIGTVFPERERELADLPVVGTMFQRGGAWPRKAKSVDELYDLRDYAQANRQVKGESETREERLRRLLLNDAALAVSGSYALANLATTTEDRREITRKATEIARRAVAEYNEDAPARAQFQRWRREIQRRVEQEEEQP